MKSNWTTPERRCANSMPAAGRRASTVCLVRSGHWRNKWRRSKGQDGHGSLRHFVLTVVFDAGMTGAFNAGATGVVPAAGVVVSTDVAMRAPRAVQVISSRDLALGRKRTR